MIYNTKNDGNSLLRMQKNELLPAVIDKEWRAEKLSGVFIRFANKPKIKLGFSPRRRK